MGSNQLWHHNIWQQWRLVCIQPKIAKNHWQHDHYMHNGPINNWIKGVETLFNAFNLHICTYAEQCINFVVQYVPKMLHRREGPGGYQFIHPAQPSHYVSCTFVLEWRVKQRLTCLIVSHFCLDPSLLA